MSKWELINKQQHFHNLIGVSLFHNTCNCNPNPLEMINLSPVNSHKMENAGIAFINKIQIEFSYYVWLWHQNIFRVAVYLFIQSVYLQIFCSYSMVTVWLINALGSWCWFDFQIKEDTDLFVIDEVGKMELFSSLFFPAVLRVLESNKPFLATVPIPKAGRDIPAGICLLKLDAAVVFSFSILFSMVS